MHNKDHGGTKGRTVEVRLGGKTGWSRRRKQARIPTESADYSKSQIIKGMWAKAARGTAYTYP